MLFADVEDNVGRGANAVKMGSDEHPGVALALVDEFLNLVQAQPTNLHVVIAVAEVLVAEDGLRDGMRARAHVLVELLPVEGVKLLVHVVGGAVRSVVGQSPALLQLLPYSPDLVHEGVVHEEDRVVGGVLQRCQAVILSPAHNVVHGVVSHFELNL